jgi:hypothetical protein
MTIVLPLTLMASLLAPVQGGAAPPPVAVVPAQTQRPPDQVPPRGGRAAGTGREAGGLRPEDVQAVLDGAEIAMAEKQIAPSDSQYAPFIQGLRKLQVARRQHLMQRQRLLGELRRLMNQQEADEAAIDAQTKKLDEMERQSYAATQDALAVIDSVLDVRQRARFRLLEEQLEARKLQLLSRALRVGGSSY